MDKLLIMEESICLRITTIIMEAIINIQNTQLIYENLKYCLVNSSKRAYRIDGSPARSNHNEDFVSLDKIKSCPKLDDYNGLGISIQASNISAIDVDKCFSKKFDLSSADERAKEILERFKDKTYCEFSFSGNGLRILLKHDFIENYENDYYIKNSKNGIEFYQPSKSNRYVTITGKCIYNNKIEKIDREIIQFLKDYMTRPKIAVKEVPLEAIECPIEKLRNKVKYLYLKDSNFQNLWFSKAPGSGADESERDYQILSILYNKITMDKDKLKLIFEDSPYFRSKDSKHKWKWEYQNNRYYNYVYEHLK